MRTKVNLLIGNRKQSFSVLLEPMIIKIQRSTTMKNTRCYSTRREEKLSDDIYMHQVCTYEEKKEMCGESNDRNCRYVQEHETGNEEALPPKHELDRGLERESQHIRYAGQDPQRRGIRPP